MRLLVYLYVCNVCHIMRTCCKSAKDGESAERAVGADIAALKSQEENSGRITNELGEACRFKI